MDKLKTFREWSSLGYTVVKGSKAQWVDNIPMFTELQVNKYTPRSYAPRRNYSSGTEYYGCTPKGSFDHWGHEATWEEFY